MTDGGLYPKTGGGGERPDKIQPITVKRPKDREINPFHLHWHVRTMLLQPTQVKTCFKKIRMEGWQILGLQPLKKEPATIQNQEWF